jgi:uncharacterized protein YnzC (UPF0291/DUF896 family)
MKKLLIVIAVVFLIFVLFLLIGSISMNRFVKKEYKELLQGDEKRDLKIITEKYLNGLPEVVKNYIINTGVVGKEVPKDVYLKQIGFFKTEPKAKWLSLKATQLFNLRTRAFIWHGIISIIPGVTIQARDYYRNQKGNMLIKFAGSITMANEKGPEMNQGAFIRFAVEAIWFPWLFADKNFVKWQHVDNRTAIAHVTDGKNSGSITCKFNEKNELIQVAAKRYMTTEQGAKLLPWGGLCSAYKEFNGIKIPSKANIYWDLPEGRFECIKLEVTDIVYGKDVKKYIK